MSLQKDEGDAIEVLRLTVEHDKDLYIKDLCRLLQVSSGCRRALQQSRSTCSVTLCRQLGLQERSKLWGFAEWLPKHAGLVSRLNWEGPGDWDRHTPEQREELRLLQRQLASALRLHRMTAAAASPGAAAPPPAGAGAAAAVVKPVPLQLTEATFGRSWPDPQLLTELAAAGLRELGLTSTRHFLEPLNFAHFSALSSLQCLWFSSYLKFGRPKHTAEFITAVGQQLTALTAATLGIVPVETAPQLPASLERLAASFAVHSIGSDGSNGSTGSIGSTVVDLRHLTALRYIRFDIELYPQDDSEDEEVLEAWLPDGLTSLDLVPHGGISRMTGASHLQEAWLLHMKNRDVNVLVHLGSLTGLKDLEIEHSEFTTAPACKGAAAALGSATGLTRLDLSSCTFAVAGLCRHLAKLPKLADLNLDCTLPDDCDDKPGDREDMLCLTALTTLTGLRLSGWRKSLPDDVVVGALARHLTGLRHLLAQSDNMSIMGVLPVVAEHLTGLSSLSLYGESFVLDLAALMLLTGLTQLEKLYVKKLECSEAEHQVFLGHMPLLRKNAR